MRHQRVKSRTKHNKKRTNNKKTRSKRTTRKRRGGASSYIMQEYNKYREELLALNDDDKLNELQEGIILTNVLKNLLGEQNASRIRNVMHSGHLQTTLINGYLNIKVFLEFQRFGMVYQCDFTNDGETVVVNIKIALPDRTFKTISYPGDQVFATEGMQDSDKEIVEMFASVMEPSYDNLMAIVA